MWLNMKLEKTLLNQHAILWEKELSDTADLSDLQDTIRSILLAVDSRCYGALKFAPYVCFRDYLLTSPSLGIRSHEFSKYLVYLTRGEYDDTPIRLLSFANNDASIVSDGRLKIEEVRDRLLLGFDTIIVAKSIANQLQKRYKRQSRNDIIPHRFVEDFRANGGMDMFRALKQGIQLEDILPSLSMGK